MIRAAAGGSPLFRLEEARRSAELRSLRGRRVAVLHGAPEIFRISGIRPALLSLSLEGGRTADIAAEYCAAEAGAENAARSFCSALYSYEGSGVIGNENQRYWHENQMLGTQLFFLASVELARRGDRPIGAIMADCIEDLRSAAAGSDHGRNAAEPEWMARLTYPLREKIASLYCSKVSSTTATHFSTLAAVVSSLRRSSPEEWTEPFVADRNGGHLSIYLPDFDDPSLFALLRLCERTCGFFVLPELHRWNENDRRRAGHFLKSASGDFDVLWTSARVPAHPGYESDEELYGRSAADDVDALFRGRLRRSGGEGDTRLKELRFETPASLDERHALRRSEAGWSLTEWGEIDRRELVELRRKSFFGASSSEEDHRKIFAMNLGERIGTPADEPEKPEESEESGKNSEETEKATEERDGGPSPSRTPALLVEGALKILETAPGGKMSLCRAGSWIFELEGVASSAGAEVLILFAAPPDGAERALLVCAKLWEAPPSADEPSPLPEVRAFLPLHPKSEDESALDEEGGLTAYSPILGEIVRFVFPGCAALPREAFGGTCAVFGTWAEPRRVFRVRTLLKVVVPGDAPGDFSEPAHVPLLPPLHDVLALGRRLRVLSRAVVLETTAAEAFFWAPEETDGFVELRAKFDGAVRSAADALAENAEIRRRLADAGETSVRLDLGDLAERGVLFSELLAAVRIDTLPPDYREILEALGLGEPFRKAFDAAFVVSALNLGTPEEDDDEWMF